MSYNVPATLSMASSSQYDSSTSGGFAHTALSVAVASVVDFGSAIHNSLNIGNWMGDDSDTYDLLNGMGMNNIAQKYLQHQGLVNGISMIGGAFVPGGLAIKASRAMRSGLAATNFLNPAAMTTNLTQIDRLVREGQRATQAYKSLRSRTIMQGLAQGATDNLFVELAIIGSMSKHPWMEDYMEDIPKNMAISLGIGSAIGGLVDYASTAYKVRKAAQKAIFETEQPVLDAIGTRFQAADDLTRAHEIQAAVQRLDGILQSGSYSQNTLDLAARQKSTMLGELGATVRNIAEPLTKTLDETQSAQVLKQIEELVLRDDFLGVATIKYADIKEDGVFVKAINKFNRARQTITKGEEAADVAQAVYNPRLGIFVSKNEAASVSGAADILSMKELRREARNVDWSIPRDRREDYWMELPSTIEARHLTTMEAFDPANFKWDVQRPTIHQNDIAGLQAAGAAWRKLQAKKIRLEQEAATLKGKQLTAAQAEIAKVQRQLDGFEVRVPKLEVAGKAINARSNQITIKGADIEALALARTNDTIEDLARQGQAPEIIALKTNTELDYVLRHLGGGNAMPGSNPMANAMPEVQDIYRTLDSSGIEDVLNPTNRLLELSDNGRLGSYKEYLDMLEGRANQQMLDQWNSQFVREALTLSESETLRDLAGRFGLQDPKSANEFIATIDIVKQQLGLINDAISRDRSFQSADMHARHMGDAGIIINSLGETFLRTANQANDKFQRMANPYLTTMATNEVQRTGALTVVQALRANKGTIVYRNRRLLIDKGVDRTGERIYEPLMWQGKALVIPKDWDAVDGLIRVWEKRGQEVHRIRTTNNQILGKADPGNVGIWVPPVDTRRRIVHFVQKTKQDGGLEYQILTGRTETEVAEKSRVLRDRYGEKISILSPDARSEMELREYERLKAEVFSGKMQDADSNLLKKGYSSEELFDTSLDALRDLEHGYSSALLRELQKSQALLMHDVLDALAVMEKQAATTMSGSNLSPIKKFLEQGVSNAGIMRKQLLGSNTLLKDYLPWQSANEGFEGIIEAGLNRMQRISRTISPRDWSNVAGDPTNPMQIKWEEVNSAMERAGFPTPFKGLNALNMEQGFAHDVSDPRARRLVAAANNFAALFALRFADTAHSLVNMLSQPILTSSAIRGGNRDSFMGHQLLRAKENLFDTAKTMMDGVAAMNSPVYRQLMKRAEGAGLLDPIVSEASAVIRAANLNEPGAIAAGERALMKLENFMPVGKNKRGIFVAFSDGSEVLSRRAAFSTGIVDGINKYGFKVGVDDAAIYIYAKDFMDRAIGNYMPNQRPVAFQGSLGAALGLFQTYMLTFAQDMYRHLEVRDFSALAQAMLWQGSIFGIPSMPGMPQLSEIIGNHYSSDNVDVKTGLFRAFESKAAQDVLVYGLPSALGSLVGLEGGGPNFSGRGTVDPRLPVIGGELPPGAAMVYGAMEGAWNVVSSMRRAGMEAGALTLAEALSQQSVSRPLARSMEIVTGHSVNQAGRTVAVREDVWQPVSILSRLIGTRPTDEVRMRDAASLNSFYGSLDREKRQVAIEDLRQHIRYGSLNGDAITRAADRYFSNNGSPNGFRSALTTAIQMDSQNMAYQLQKDMDWNSPFMQMLNNL